MKTVTQIEQNITLVSFDDRDIYLVGTAHVSKSSAELVERSILELQPDTICVELCAPRYESLRNPERWKNTDIVQVIREGRLGPMMAQLALAGFQKRLAKQFGVAPGAEMREAIRLSDEKKITLSLVDREIKTTLRRAWKAAGFRNVIKMIASMLNSLISSEEITEDEIERLKKGDALEGVLSEFNELLPEVKTVLIDERDAYMASKIYTSGGKKILAVLGAGHIPGITKLIGSEIDLVALERIPAKGLKTKLFQWGVPALFVLLLVVAMFRSGTEAGLEMAGIWAVTNGICAGIGALLALAHPITILVAILSAPFAAIHPLIAVGWICAIVEAWLRKPLVADFENIAEDILKVKTIWTNRVSHLFVLMALSNLGSVAGSAIGLYLAAHWKR